MSLSSSRVGYRHRVTVLRDTGTRDSWGDPTGPAWVEALADVPCRAWTNGGREPIADDRVAVVEDRRISVALGTDITEADRVSAVTDAAGREVFDGPMSVSVVLRHSDHQELLVERVR